ncbi:hypothetical protein M9H77_23314 [Catharanthus roseus]|uniref:Uncharacterized protein n=1 Tax=Catharanthus roseus TaxID=4058 RepID=A0ACC0AX01_CATRO|nr:hypothetical protein M9H77_23314 [Catharanthus roseus]
MGVRLLVIERSYVVWLVFDYKMQELGSDGLILGIQTLSVEPNCCIICSFKFGRRSCADVSLFAQTSQLSSKPSCSFVPRGTQISYSAAVDLVAELGVSQVVSELYVRFVVRVSRF